MPVALQAVDANWAAVSRWLFLGIGALWLVIGLLTPGMMNRPGGLFISARTDRELYGQEPAEALQNETLRGVRESIVVSLAGMLAVGGLLVVAVAWFGLPTGEAWPFWTLVAMGALALPYWILVLRPYWAAGIRTGLSDMPPFMWVTTVLWLLGTVAGLVARRGA